MNSKVLTAPVPLPLAEKVDELAARQDRSRGWIVKQALTAWVEQEEEPVSTDEARPVRCRCRPGGEPRPHAGMGRQPRHRQSVACTTTAMILEWTIEAVDVPDRLHRFLEGIDQRAARQVAVSLVRATMRQTEHPRRAIRMDEFEGREVRRIVVGQYEIRYEVTASVICVLRIWHGREDR